MERRPMSSKSRRFEVLLPVRFNDGRDIPEELLGEAVNEIVSPFGAVSFYRQAIEGHWQHGSALYRDDLACLVVDVADTVKNRKWMKAFKARWKKRLEQLPGMPMDLQRLCRIGNRILLLRRNTVLESGNTAFHASTASNPAIAIVVAIINSLSPAAARHCISGEVSLAPGSSGPAPSDGSTVTGPTLSLMPHRPTIWRAI